MTESENGKSPPGVTAFRDELRKRLISKREAMPEEVRATASEAIAGHLERLLARLAPACLAFCWPFRGEFDARPLAGRLNAGGLALALPVVVAPGQPMAFREWTPRSAMMEDRYGIPIPADGAHLVPDLILMPVNGFDAAGYRLGYGGGYFDRTLATLAPRPLAVGVGFELARLDSIRPQPFDQPMDWLVTESGIFRGDERGLTRQ